MAASPSPLSSSPTSTARKSAKPAIKIAKLERAAATVLSALQSIHPELSPALPQLVGVSGGRDSVALLHLLLAIGYDKLVVCHVNHGLRGAESDLDEEHVKALAEQYRLTHESIRLDIRTRAAETKASIETAAREARREYFQQMAGRHGCRNVFLAHHADDDAETILHHLVRGTGLRGIQGMQQLSKTKEGLWVTRPLLEVPRKEIDRYVESHHLAYREDSSNTSSAPTRNRIRHQLLPLMQEVFHRDVATALLRFAHLVGQDEECLHDLAHRLMQDHDLLQPDGSLKLVPAFQQAHPALQSRILRHWLREVHHVKNVGAAELTSAIALLTPGNAAKMNLAGDVHLRRKARRLFLEEVKSPRKN